MPHITGYECDQCTKRFDGGEADVFGFNVAIFRTKTAKATFSESSTMGNKTYCSNKCLRLALTESVSRLFEQAEKVA